MARNLIIFSLVVLSMIAIASSETKKKDLGKIIVHGTVLCKQGNKTIEGATVTLNCTGQPQGDKPRQIITVVSNPTNAKGEYTIGVAATLESGEKLIHCKVTLKSSPLKTCKVPTNINKGIKGFGLTSVKHTDNPKDKLFLVPALFFTSSK
ncbi:protein SEED AND ROOT HAIR PROTECTIVE PROTEIN [Beta vulgaris subsp. vulgaris]|uniref:protein SEED AND ROOT HAIR PROTECTIVE PROTEIN n=1 Tax=Beta vulgaris subsp. vulgaris TaxID=3555 RepID=UPI002036E923|nr:protein SEED AND ROOT HAIR PROTECTIVE PROTEIN [Beta vulgaris subsp. vulgaris]